MDPLTPDEERLLADIKDALRAAEHPRTALIVANAQDSFTYATLDDELARLVYDSLLEGDPVGAARANDSSRMVIFECEALTMEVEIRGRDVVGQLGPPGPATVRVESSDGSSCEVQADPLGCFSARLPYAGSPVRFRVSRPGSTAVTEWTYGPETPG